MVEQGRSADRDTDSVRGETPLQSGSEKRISPRNISAEHQYVRVETGKDRTRELRQLFAVAEAYPDLKANTNFTQLQASLEDTENKISYARQSYNDCVLSYNNAIQTFPAVIFAGIFQFKERQGFEAAEAARQAPTVKF